MTRFCPACETSHAKDEPCSIRGLAAVKVKGSEPPFVEVAPVPDAPLDLANPVRPRIVRSKAELKAIIAQLEEEKSLRRKRKAASQKRWRYKKAGKEGA